MSAPENEAPEENGINAKIGQESGDKKPIYVRIFRPAWNYVRRNDSHLVIATYLLGIGTLWLAWLALQSISVTREALREQRKTDGAQLVRVDSQLAIARRTMVSQLRAYLSVEGISDISQIRTDRHGYFIAPHIKFTNRGQTPATHITFRVTGVQSPSGTETHLFDSNWINPEISAGPLEPGASAGWEQPIHITPKLRFGKYWIFIWGKISYDDVFGISRWRTFKVKWKAGDPVWTGCKWGNDEN